MCVIQAHDVIVIVSRNKVKWMDREEEISGQEKENGGGGEEGEEERERGSR